MNKVNRIGRDRCGSYYGVTRSNKAYIENRYNLAGLMIRPLPAWVEARLNAAEPAQLETWALRVLDGASLEEVFAAGEGH